MPSMPISRLPMPFPRVPCAVWLPHRSEPDAYGNEVTTYEDEPDMVTECSYAPGYRKPDTSDGIEDGRPYATETRVLFFLPMAFDADLRDALLQARDPKRASISRKRFAVVGDPEPYMDDATPGDMGWCVEGVRFDG